MATIETLPILDPQTLIGRGGFGELFPDPREESRCIKVLKSPLTGESAAGITRLVNVLKWACPSDATILTSRFAWPVELFGTTDEISGFSMPRAPQSTRFSLTAGRQTSERDLQAKFLMDDAYWQSAAIRSPKPDFSVADRIEIVLDLVYSVLVLHRNGLTYGDVSSNNVAVRAEEVPGVFMFDADSIVPVIERASSPLVSPGWEVADGLDPLEIDRARMALFALRIFVEHPTAAASDESINAASSLIGGHAARAIAAAVESGAATALDEMVTALRARRTPARARAAFDAAVESRIAKWVIRESDHAEHASDRRVVDEALSQLSFENTVMALGGSKRRSALRRDNLQRSAFELDVPPVISLPNPPTTEEALKTLVYEAMFEEIASHLVAEGLGSLERHSWTDRAVRRALVEGEDPQVQVRHSPGQASVRVWWPVDQFVNVVNLTITYPGGTFTSELRRGDADSQMNRELNLPAGGRVQVNVVPGSISPNGSIVWSPRHITEQIDVAPLPRPDRPIVSAKGTTSPHAAIATVIDPEEERQRLLLERFEQERAAAEAARQRRRRRLLIATVLVAVLALSGSASWWFLLRGEQNASGYLDRLDPATYDQSRPVSQITALASGRTINVTWLFAVNSDGERPDQYRAIVHDLSNSRTRQLIVRTGSEISIPIGTPGTYEISVGAEWFGSSERNVIPGPTLTISPSAFNGARFLSDQLTVGVDVDGLHVIDGSGFGEGNSHRIRWTSPDGSRFETPLVASSRTDLVIDSPGTWAVSVLLSTDRGTTVIPLPSIVVPDDHPALIP